MDKQIEGGGQNILIFKVILYSYTLNIRAVPENLFQPILYSFISVHALHWSLTPISYLLSVPCHRLGERIEDMMRPIWGIHTYMVACVPADAHLKCVCSVLDGRRRKFDIRTTRVQGQVNVGKRKSSSIYSVYVELSGAGVELSGLHCTLSCLRFKCPNPPPPIVCRKQF